MSGFSVSKSEVQPLVTLILRGLQVLVLLILTHRTPHLLSSLVAPGVVQPGENEQNKGKDVDSNQYAVTTVVERLVVFAIDVG